jgi:hypothetical protein
VVVDRGLRLTQWVLSPTITSSRTSITRCPSVASLYRVDALKAPVLSIRRIHLACWRISKCENYWLFCLVVELGVRLTSWVLPPTTIPSSRTKSCHNSMRRHCIIIPSGCAECASPRHSAHPLTRSAHLERRKLLAFLCCCGYLPVCRSDLVRSPSYYHQLTDLPNSMPQRRIVIPSGCAECAAPTHLAHTLARSAHLEMRKLLAFLSCCGHRGTSDPVGAALYYHQLTKDSEILP